MRRFLFLFAFLFAGILPAQEQPNFVKALRMSKQLEEQMKKEAIEGMQSDNVIDLMHFYFYSLEGRKSFGVSDTQHQEMMQCFVPPKEGDDAEFDALRRQFKEAEEAKDEQKTAELQEQIQPLIQKRIDKWMNDVMTPELKRKIQETQLATMEFRPFVPSSVYEALDISAEQKAKIDAVYKELEPESDKKFGAFFENIFKERNKILDYLEKNSPVITDQKEYYEKSKAARKYLLETDPEVKKLFDDAKGQLKQIMMMYKFKVYDLLTDAQLKKLQDLTDNPPEYAKFVTDTLRKMHQEIEGKEDVSRTFMNSWQPGDAIPVEYKEHRRKAKAFPSSE